jgi:hypothetical protein
MDDRGREGQRERRGGAEGRRAARHTGSRRRAHHRAGHSQQSIPCVRRHGRTGRVGPLACRAFGVEAGLSGPRGKAAPVAPRRQLTPHSFCVACARIPTWVSVVCVRACVGCMSCPSALCPSPAGLPTDETTATDDGTHHAADTSTPRTQERAERRSGRRCNDWR